MSLLRWFVDGQSLTFQSIFNEQPTFELGHPLAFSADLMGDRTFESVQVVLQCPGIEPQLVQISGLGTNEISGVVHSPLSDARCVLSMSGTAMNGSGMGVNSPDSENWPFNAHAHVQWLADLATLPSAVASIAPSSSSCSAFPLSQAQIAYTAAPNSPHALSRVELFEVFQPRTAIVADLFHTKIAEDESAPFVFTIPNPAPGTYNYYALLTDSRGIKSRFDPSGIGFCVAMNQAPTILVNTPAANTNFAAPGTLTLSANAFDSDGYVKYLRFFNGATLLQTITRNSASSDPFVHTWNNVAIGTYQIHFEAEDNRGERTKVGPIPVTVSNLPPTVSITGPTHDGTYIAGGTTNIFEATIRDDRQPLAPTITVTVPNWNTVSLTGSVPQETAAGSGIWKSTASLLMPLSTTAQISYGGNSTVRANVTDSLGLTAVSENRRLSISRAPCSAMA